ncbi:MAG: AMP-binding protein [Clostridium sp.]|jgi:long-chain acyl-CoA synthetase|nr:AMP-binding protein [Clostridium sp.]
MKNAIIHEVLKNALDKWTKKGFIYTRNGGTFEPKTFGDAVYDTWALAESLLELGLQNKHILIFGENSYEWAIADFAIMAYVGVSVAANKEWKKHDLINVINIADVACVIYANTRKEVINSLRSEFDIKFISMQDDLPSLLQNGYELLSQKKKKDGFRIKSADEMCKIYFTSGTTSVSKAVMLSDKNLFAGFASLYKRAPMDEIDKAYLFLPFSHTYGGVYNLLACLYFGNALYLCSDTDRMFEEMQMCSPTVFCGVPLIYERVYGMLGEETIRQAQIEQNQAVIQKIKAMFGGNIKYLFCAGAKQNVAVRKFFKDIGFCMLEAYALTETASSLSIEYIGSTSLTSVGTIYEDLEVAFADVDENGHGEVLVRGDVVALGYYHNEQETKRAFDADGFFHTGDIGYKDEDNQLYLVGRKKRVIIFSNGENIYPDEIEELLMQHREVSKAKVFEKDGVLSAILYLKEEINAAQFIEKTNELLPTYKQIKTFETVTDSLRTRMK